MQKFITRRFKRYTHRMGSSFTVAAMVVVLVAVFAALALPEIADRLLTAQTDGTGISVLLDQSITAFSYFLQIGVLAILAALVAMVRR